MSLKLYTHPLVCACEITLIMGQIPKFLLRQNQRELISLGVLAEQRLKDIALIIKPEIVNIPSDVDLKLRHASRTWNEAGILNFGSKFFISNACV